MSEIYNIVGETYNWQPSLGLLVAEHLNRNASLIKNSLAGIYNVFREIISTKWSGVQYNEVVKYINAEIPNFQSIVEFLGVEVPTKIFEISEKKAIAGQGSLEFQSYTLDSNSSNPDMYPVEESTITSDGITKLDEEILIYFKGEEYPSINAARNNALKYLSDYLTIFEEHADTFKGADNSFSNIISRVGECETQIRNKLEEIFTVLTETAIRGVNKIEDANVEAVKEACKVTNSGLEWQEDKTYKSGDVVNFLKNNGVNSKSPVIEEIMKNPEKNISNAEFVSILKKSGVNPAKSNVGSSAAAAGAGSAFVSGVNVTAATNSNKSTNTSASDFVDSADASKKPELTEKEEAEKMYHDEVVNSYKNDMEKNNEKMNDLQNKIKDQEDILKQREINTAGQEKTQYDRDIENKIQKRINKYEKNYQDLVDDNKDLQDIIDNLEDEN